MRIFREINFRSERVPRALALGFFDGVHLGHQTLLRRMKESAEENGYRPTVFTFQDPPGRIFPERGAFRGLLQDEYSRYGCLQSLGASEIVAAPSIPEIFNLAPEEFLERYLRELLDVREAIAGFDFSFGAKAGGDMRLLKQFCDHYQIKLSVMPEYRWQGESLSSSLIREKLVAGETELAAAMMGRPFSHYATIREGQKLGRKLGFPTVNLCPDPSLVVPRTGVYQSQVVFNGLTVPAISNIGKRPTVTSEEDAPVLSETYLYGDYAPSYGDAIRVNYLRFIRDEVKFSDVEELKEKVQQDLEQVRQIHRADGYLL